MKITLCRLPYNSVLGIRKSAYPLWAGYLFSAIEDLLTDQAKVRFNFVDGETLKFSSKSLAISNDFVNKAITAFYPRLLIDFDRLKEFAFDMNSPLWAPYINKVLSNDPDLVAVSAYTNQLAVLKTFARIVKRECPKCKILLGGIHITTDYKNLRDEIPEVDYYCIGEGENTFREVVLSMINGKDLSNVAGIHTYHHPEKYQPRALIRDLDHIKEPNRMLTSKRLYRDDFHIFSSRGCPFGCNFCSSHKMWSKKVRFHSVERIVAEIEYIYERLNGHRITFVDDTFTLDKERVYKIMDAIVERRYNSLNIHVGARIDTVNKEMIDVLREGGVSSMSFGIETGSPKIQKLSKKRLDRKRIVETLHYAKSVGMHTLTYYIVGHPQESEGDVNATIELIKASGASKVSVCAMQPLPGTEIYEIAKNKGFNITAENSLGMDQLNVPAINLTHMSDKLLKDKVYEAYRISNRISQKGRIKQAVEYYAGKLVSNIKSRMESLN